MSVNRLMDKQNLVYQYGRIIQQQKRNKIAIYTQHG